MYQHDSSIRELATEIVSCQPLSSLDSADRALFKNIPDEDDTTNIKNHVVTVKETIFHPKGGGQPSDTGIIKAIAAPGRNQGKEDEEEENDNEPVIFQVHLVRKSPTFQILHAGHFTTSTATFTRGQHALQILDSAKRDYHSRLHTAGHIIDVAVDLLIAAGTGTGTGTTIGPLQKSKANHAPGEACVEWRGHIPSDLKTTIQDKANEIVQRNLPVNILWWTEEQLRVESEGNVVPPDTIPPPENGLYRVVDIGGLGNSCPCGGTHLPRTGDVGFITVRKVSRQKGVSKVSYEVKPTMEEDR